jgi:rhodanese-related sulfurtransferase
MVGLNTAIRRFGKAWVPVRTEWEIRIAQPPDPNVSYREENVTEDLEIDPRYGTRTPFVMDDVPNDTETVFLAASYRRMPGEFVWRDGKPLPCVDEEALAQLKKSADDLAGCHAEPSSADVFPLQPTGKWGEERVAFLLRASQAGDERRDTRDPSPSSGVTPVGGTVPQSHVAAVKRQQAPHCGLYCLYLAMRTQGYHPAFGDLIRPEYLDTANGSTLTGLKMAAEDAGLHAEVLRRANTRMLRACSNPVLLHVKGSDVSRDYDHYLLFLATQGQQAQVYDPPRPVKLMSFNELVSRWDGKGLVVSREPVQLAGLVHRETARLFLVAGAAIVLLFLVSRVHSRIPQPRILSGVFGRAGLSGAQAGALAAIALGIGLVCHSVTEAGFLAYPAGVAATQRAHASDFIPRIDLPTAQRWHERGAIFIDARLKPDFDAGHVERAISIPVDANDVVRRKAVKDLCQGDSIVVYCQSESCSFAEVVAAKLHLDGFSNISILPGGWMEWTTGVRLPKPNKNSEPVKWRQNEDGTASPI